MAKEEAKKPIVNTIILPIHEVEDDAVIVNIDGWRIRAYFDQSLTKEDKEKYALSQEIEIKYTGELKNIHSIKLLTLK
jgi:hypothetical protein